MKLKFLILTGIVGAAYASDAYYPYLQGLLAERNGDAGSALSNYEKVVEMDPQAMEVYRSIAQLQLRQGNSEAALKAAERALALEPKDPESYLFLGNIYLARGDVKKAVEQYEKVLVLNPSHPRALENLGHYYVGSQPEKAIGYFKKFLEKEPTDPSIQFQIGMAYLKLGNRAESEKWLKSSLEQEPQQIASHVALAELYESQKSSAAAVAQLETVLELDPRNTLLRMKLGTLHYQQREWGKAQAQFLNIAEREPENVSAWYWLARTAEETQSWSQASQYAEKAYDLSQEGQFLPLLAYYASMQKKHADAIHWLEEAKLKKVTAPHIHLYLGMSYLEAKQPQKAKDALEEAQRLTPKDSQVLFQLALVYDQLGEFPKTEKTLKQLIELDPKQAIALNYLGYSWADKKINLPEAESLIRRAIALEPTNAAYLDSLGWVLVQQDKVKEALPYLRRAAQDGQDALIWEHLGDAYWKLQDATRALRFWEISLATQASDRVQKKSDEAWKSVQKQPDLDAILEAVSEQFSELKQLEGALRFKGTLQKFGFQATGRLRLGNPTLSEGDLEVRDKKLPAAFVYQWKKGRLTWSPPEAELWRAQAQEVIPLLQKYFSAAYLDSASRAQWKTKTTSKTIEIRFKTQTVVIDMRKQVLTQWKEETLPKSVRELRWGQYLWQQGFWVPKQLDWKESAHDLELRATVSEWKLNHNENKSLREN